ncbi:alpha/beta hydrolase [Actinocorallia longicatena]|uniref:Alpha/beta hydrolase n=1 Tax=Actinocorallia longicatena TaxID=111803 RepID=A0ABP6QH80_9ACTN
MNTAVSADGTTLAYDDLGSGEPIVLVSGASCARGVHAHAAGLLSSGLRVLNYDRRGRGDSTDTAPFAVEREIEDLAAMIDAAGGSAAVFGSSSGAVLALRAAIAGLPVTRLVLWEPPFEPAADAPARQAAYVAELTAALDRGDRGAAQEAFMRRVGLPEQMIAGARRSPMWKELEEIAHTLPYDAAAMGDCSVPAGAAGLATPVLVAYGTASGDWARNAADALTAAAPAARSTALDGQHHDVDFTVLAPVIEDFARNP